jgi:hypothetical protein
LNLEKIRKKARECPYAFSQYMATDFDCPLDKMHKQWHEHISDNLFTVITSPKDHRKTTTISVERCLWELGKNRDLRIKIISHSDDLSCKILSEIKGHIAKDGGKYHDIFPDITDEGALLWSASKIQLGGSFARKDSSIEACGVLASATGGKADLVLFDDVVSFKNAILNPSMRQQVIDAFFGNWMDIKSGPKARIIYVATPWHKDDLTAKLLKTPRFQSYKYFIDENFTPVWPQRWPKEALIQEFKFRGAVYFNPAFRGLMMSDFDKVFNKDILQRCCTPRANMPDIKDLDKYIGVDLAIGTKKKSKYSVLFGLAYDEEKKIRYPVEIRRGKYSSPDTARELIDMYDEIQPQCAVVENNFYQQAIIDWLEDMEGVDMNIEPFTTGSNQKKSLDFGVPAMATDFQNNRWVIPMEEDEYDWELEQGCGCNICNWVTELLQYPYGTYSDVVMASYLAVQGSKKYSNEGTGRGGFASWNMN